MDRKNVFCNGFDFLYFLGECHELDQEALEKKISEEIYDAAESGHRDTEVDVSEFDCSIVKYAVIELNNIGFAASSSEFDTIIVRW